jgi:hypothetical protein
VQSLADSGVLWILLIAGIVAVFFLPTIIGLIRGVDRLGFVVMLNVLGWIGWPAALILALGPRRTPPPPPPVIVYVYPWPVYVPVYLPADSPQPGALSPQHLPEP